MTLPRDCPDCGRELVMVEVLGVYDGALYLECLADWGGCGKRINRWSENDYLYPIAQAYVDHKEVM